MDKERDGINNLWGLLGTRDRIMVVEGRVVVAVHPPFTTSLLVPCLAIVVLPPCICVCVCARACARARVCVCVCVCVLSRSQEGLVEPAGSAGCNTSP